MTTVAAGTVRFCLTCGKDRQVDPISFRCLNCGKPTGRPDNTPAQVVPAPAQPAVTLPSSPVSRRWVKQTRALADDFSRAAEKAEKRAKDAAAKAERLRTAASAFTRLLTQVSVQEDGLPQPARSNGLNGRWSRAHECCLKCGRVDRPHKASGLCNSCWKYVPKSA